MAFRLLLASALIATVTANSLGLNVPTCSTDDPEIWKSTEAGGKYMYWCDAAKWDSDFSVRTADGETKDDPKTYRPGGLVYIHIRALKQGLKYRGLLLYAEDSAEPPNKVGTWELPTEDEISFHTPPGSCEDQVTGALRAVMHSGADPKHYHNVFAFRAPGGFSSKIVFKVLLKSGEANLGAFHWPTSNAGSSPLTLTAEKGKTGPPNNWIFGKNTQSCTEACDEVNKDCNAQALKNINSAEKFQMRIGKEHVCKLPILERCVDVGPYTWAPRNFCWYTPANSCAEDATCDSKLPDANRFCACRARTLLSQDSWSETDEQESWTELADIERLALLENDAAPSASTKCDRFFTQSKCQAAGCSFTEQQGMVLCKEKSK